MALVADGISIFTGTARPPAEDDVNGLQLYFRTGEYEQVWISPDNEWGWKLLQRDDVEFSAALEPPAEDSGILGINQLRLVFDEDGSRYLYYSFAHTDAWTGFEIGNIFDDAHLQRLLTIGYGLKIDENNRIDVDVSELLGLISSGLLSVGGGEPDEDWAESNRTQLYFRGGANQQIYISYSGSDDWTLLFSIPNRLTEGFGINLSGNRIDVDISELLGLIASGLISVGGDAPAADSGSTDRTQLYFRGGANQQIYISYSGSDDWTLLYNLTPRGFRMISDDQSILAVGRDGKRYWTSLYNFTRPEESWGSSLDATALPVSALPLAALEKVNNFILAVSRDGKRYWIARHNFTSPSGRWNSVDTHPKLPAEAL